MEIVNSEVRKSVFEIVTFLELSTGTVLILMKSGLSQRCYNFILDSRK